MSAALPQTGSHCGVQQAAYILSAGSAPEADTHQASALCVVPADVALAFLSDGLALGRWALGAWNTEAAGGGVFRGRSLFDDCVAYVMPVADPAQAWVDFHVGATPERLAPRIRAVVAPVGPANAAKPVSCLVTLIAWRDASMDDARWLRLVRCHDTEILLIQALLARRSQLLA